MNGILQNSRYNFYRICNVPESQNEDVVLILNDISQAINNFEFYPSELDLCY